MTADPRPLDTMLSPGEHRRRWAIEQLIHMRLRWKDGAQLCNAAGDLADFVGGHLPPDVISKPSGPTPAAPLELQVQIQMLVADVELLRGWVRSLSVGREGRSEPRDTQPEPHPARPNPEGGPA